MKVCTTCGTEYPDEQKFCPKDGSALRSTASADLVGSVIADRYHISKKLGEGGMGAVYLGEHVKMGRKSAIKVMSQSMANDPDAIARFNREAANAARIAHPNVCAIYDFGETKDGLIYLAMEFIEGQALTDIIEREGALQPARAASILHQTADALQAAHDLGIVHRDLKPDNIMIARGRDGSDVVKVVDFGIAKAMGGEEGQKVTKTGLVVGTPEYMSPEQLSGDKLDGRSDIYSLALVLYRMLTGVLPFQADSAQETMIKRLTDDPLPLNSARPGLSFPDRLQTVMDRALARMPSGRYASAAEFGKDVASATQGMVQAPMPDTEGATQLIDTDAATAVLAKTRVGGERAKTPDTPAPSVAMAKPTAKRKTPVVAIAAAAVLVLGGGGAAVLFLKGHPDQTAANPPAATGVDSTHQRSVTGGTATPPAGSDTSRLRTPARQQPETSSQKPPVKPPEHVASNPTGGTPSVATPPATPPDSAALSARINTLTDPLLADNPTSLSNAAKAELRGIAENRAAPPAIRGQAARGLLFAYQNEHDTTQMCSWGRTAQQYPMSAFQRTGVTNLLATIGCR